ncbi:hypothetical protein AJ78_07140 [Emergomyces pasteurianus Ep9510]|uniref:C2H2-type domain-containing protein n=1 Tax=Emergomyces pasteurianus Ep9510 TaxID=1447872 RepID=A0A1J9P8J1_9EURO|nr:hypothetical protein AJ78_07140 [Emergomyces pasteurianus Ep9510]
MTRRYAANLHSGSSHLPTSSDVTSVSPPEQDQRSIKDSTKSDSRFHKIPSYQFHQENYPSPPNIGNADKVACERHVDTDLPPYMCIAHEYPESHPMFPEFDDWLNHMQGHGDGWYQEVFHLKSWACMLCEAKLEFYFDSKRLLAHMNEEHSELCTKQDLEIISRKRRKQPLREMEGKSARVDLEMSHPKPHTSLDDHSLDFDGTAENFDNVEGSPGPKASKSMALQHIIEKIGRRQWSLPMSNHKANY